MHSYFLLSNTNWDVKRTVILQCINKIAKILVSFNRSHFNLDVCHKLELPVFLFQFVTNRNFLQEFTFPLYPLWQTVALPAENEAGLFSGTQESHITLSAGRAAAVCQSEHNGKANTCRNYQHMAVVLGCQRINDRHL